MFQIGDIIRQRYQKNAPLRLVVKLTDDPDVVVVHDPEQGYRKVFVWGHDVVHPSNDGSLKEAQERVLSEEYVNTTSKEHW